MLQDMKLIILVAAVVVPVLQDQIVLILLLAVLVFDVVIVVGAVMVWYNIKQALPPAEATVRVIGQQWAWTFVHPGPDGEIDTEGGLYLAPHDLARIAYLFLRKGEWNGKQILSREWIERSTAPIIPDIRPDNGRPDQGYGYQWWVPRHENGVSVVYQGSGYGGQFPIVVPHLDLVVVFNAWNIHDRPKLSTQAALRDIIIPAASR